MACNDENGNGGSDNESAASRFSERNEASTSGRSDGGERTRPGQKMRRRDRPPEFWDARRVAKNRAAQARNRDNRRQRNEANRLELEARLASMSLEERQAHLRAEDELIEQQKREAAAQRALVDEGLRTGLRIVIDCTFSLDEQDRHLRSLCKQVQLAIGANKRASRPVALTVTGYAGRVREIGNAMGGEGWRINVFEEPTLEAFPADKIVVLSPDADEPLEALDRDTVYVIGGIVDRSVSKNQTKNWADQHGLRCARLPIAEHVAREKGQVKRVIMNINDVAAALIAVQGEGDAGGDWAAALDAAIPQRKRTHAAVSRFKVRAAQRAQREAGEASDAGEAGGVGEERAALGAQQEAGEVSDAGDAGRAEHSQRAGDANGAGDVSQSVSNAGGAAVHGSVVDSSSVGSGEARTVHDSGGAASVAA